MSDVLVELRPWRNIRSDWINNLFTSSGTPSIKCVNGKILMLAMNYAREILDKNDHLNKSCLTISNLKLVESAYENRLNKDSSLQHDINYECQIKEIKLTIGYFVDAFFEDTASNLILKDILDFQMSQIKKFIELNVDITKLIQIYLEFNTELKRLMAKLNKLHVKFGKSLPKKVTDLFKLILEGNDMETLEVRVRFDTVKIYLNFVTALASLDYSLYVETDKLKSIQDEYLESTLNDKIMRVKNVGKIIELMPNIKHHLLDVLFELFDMACAKEILNSGSKSLDNLEARAEFISSLSMSLRYFKDQLKYADLSAFKDDCLGPYNNAIAHKSNSSDEFKNKLANVRRSRNKLLSFSKFF